MISVTCDVCKKKIDSRYESMTAIARSLSGDEFIFSGPRYHVIVKDPLNDDLELDICKSCHAKISGMIEKLMKEENDG